MRLPCIQRSGPSDVLTRDFLLLNLKKWVSFTGCGFLMLWESLWQTEVSLEDEVVTFLCASLPVEAGDIINPFRFNTSN